jgi:TnpA family transposase
VLPRPVTLLFNRLGELRARSYEEQQGCASGLTLLTAAIGLWDAVYLERVVAELRAPAGEVVVQDLAVGGHEGSRGGGPHG